MRNFDQEAEDRLRSVKYDLSPRSKKRCEAEAASFRSAARPDDERLYVMRHRAAFHDMLLLVGRVNAYRQRLEDLKGRARGVHLTSMRVVIRCSAQAAHEVGPGKAPIQ